MIKRLIRMYEEVDESTKMRIEEDGVVAIMALIFAVLVIREVFG